MESLYIQVENGEPVNHPALESNLLDAFGSIPSNWEPFIRKYKPEVDTANTFQIVEESPVYTKQGNNWEDVWIVRDMTQEEKDAWVNSPNNIYYTQAEALRQHRIFFCNSQISAQTDPVLIQAWNDCLEANKNHVLVSYNPIDPPFPKYPGY